MDSHFCCRESKDDSGEEVTAIYRFKYEIETTLLSKLCGPNVNSTIRHVSIAFVLKTVIYTQLKAVK